MDVDDDVYDDDHGVQEMIGELYAAAEADGERPKFRCMFCLLKTWLDSHPLICYNHSLTT